MMILGDQEIENGTASVRSRLHGDLGSMEVDALIAKMKQEVKDLVTR